MADESRRYNVNDRYRGGAADPRLSAPEVENKLNQKLFPQLPTARATAQGEAPYPSGSTDSTRRRLAGLSARFK